MGDAPAFVCLRAGESAVSFGANSPLPVVTSLRHLCAFCLALAAASLLHAQSPNLHLGDVDDDGVITVRDIALVVEHLKGSTPLDAPHAVLADVTKDGAVNQADVDELIKEVLETRTPETLPLSTVRFTSPATGEGDVSVNRETIVHFTVPLAINAALDTTKFYAEFAGRKVLSRVEISSDRKKASLFYLEPLPANSRVKVTFDGSALTDLIGRGFDADGDGAAGGVYRMSFDTHTNSGIPATGITGRVLQAAPEASATVPANYPAIGVPGVTITVDGQEQTMRTTTDAQGYFTLTPCPSGVFFVHIDGRTSPWSAWPSGQYFPTVGKQWEAVPGKADNLAAGTGLVYLPCVCSGTLQPTSQTQDTSIAFPQQVLTANAGLAGTTISVPANSVFSDDGTRGGKIGIAPVPANRLPSPLPPGLNLPLVITVQSDGATNFDRPAPVCFPNLPDPITGLKPGPGEKSALWSFNHDTGQWEVVGPMTVTADGNFVKSDAGVGIRQPGWHGVQDGSQTDNQDPGEPCNPGEPRDPNEVGCPEGRCGQLPGNYMKGIVGGIYHSAAYGLERALSKAVSAVLGGNKIAKDAFKTAKKIADTAPGNEPGWDEKIGEDFDDYRKALAQNKACMDCGNGVPAPNPCAGAGAGNGSTSGGSPPVPISPALDQAINSVTDAQQALGAVQGVIAQVRTAAQNLADLSQFGDENASDNFGLTAAQQQSWFNNAKIIQDHMPKLDAFAARLQLVQQSAEMLEEITAERFITYSRSNSFWRFTLASNPSAMIRMRSGISGKLSTRLASSSDYVLSVYSPAGNSIGTAVFRTSSTGVRTLAPRVILFPD